MDLFGKNVVNMGIEPYNKVPDHFKKWKIKSSQREL
jgi:hypothetical protein